MKTFLICPIRDATDEQKEEILKIVNELESKSYDVYFPSRDTNQIDPTGGLRICFDNLNAIKSADIIHIIWDGKSQGGLFDLGMAFALGKNIIPISIPEPSEGKSFQNMMLSWVEYYKRFDESKKENVE